MQATLQKRKETAALIEQRAIEGLAAEAEAIIGDMEAQSTEDAWKEFDSTLLAADEADAINIITAAANEAASAAGPK